MIYYVIFDLVVELKLTKSKIMKPLIYYPSFEPPDEIWLKFALLYFKECRPIIPYNRENLVSNGFREIKENTNLINAINPGYNEGVEASIKAREEVESICRRPHERSHHFNHVNIVRKFRDEDSWDYELFVEKFSYEWKDYIIENGFGKKTDNGLLMSKDLGFIFMSFLASEIAYVEDTAIVTDNDAFDNFTNSRRMNNIGLGRRNNFAKGIINLLVPQNLSEIPFEKLIKFRNKNIGHILAFNNQLDLVEDKIGRGYVERDFIKEYNEIYSDFNKKVIGQGIGLLAIPFSAFMMIQNPFATAISRVKDIMGMLGVAYGGTYTLNKGLVDIENQRNCKKYLTNLGRLKI